MFGRHKTDVLVVGAGPVGLLAAISLHARGIGVEIYDQDSRAVARSYALALHPASLRLLDDLGLAQELVRSGTKVRRLRFYGADAPQAAIELEALRGPFPYVLVVPQSTLETVLGDHLRQSHVPIHRSHRVQNLDEAPDVVTAEVHKLDIVNLGYPAQISEAVITKTQQVDARFVIGADGFSSRVRSVLDIPYTEHGQDLTLDVTEFDAAHSFDPEVRVVLAPESTNVLWPIEGTRQRWCFEVAPAKETSESSSGVTSAPARATTPQPNAGSATMPTVRESAMELLRRRIAERAPWYHAVPDNIRWSTRVEFANRLVPRFGRHRTWLIGDAAHLTSPVGVQSMNIGLREAHDLATRLANILGAGAGLDTLEEFNSERQMEWRQLLGLEARVDATYAVSPWVRENANRIVSCVPACGAELETMLEQIGLSLV